MKELVVGIVGLGFVGKAVASGFSKCKQYWADPKLGMSLENLVLGKPDIVFICVPTPTVWNSDPAISSSNGMADASIVLETLRNLKKLGLPDDVPMVLKSTITPDDAGSLSREYESFVYNPEFLTEANAAYDFEHADFIALGGKREVCKLVKDVYAYGSNVNLCPVICMTAAEASYLKYGLNCYFATKVLFMNQLRDLMSQTGDNYEVVKQTMKLDSRMGKSHMDVPGADGKSGYGGACFGKDVPAFIKYALGSGIDQTVIKAGWNANCAYRKENMLEREKVQNQHYEEIK